MKIHRQLKNLWLRFGYSCINITLLILNFGLVWLLKIFYGEQAVKHFLPCPIWVADVSLMIQHVPTAQTNMKMCCMRFGTVQSYLQFGTNTLNGILGEIWVFGLSTAAILCTGFRLQPRIFSMLTRTIWFRCNKVRFSPPGFPLDQVLQRAITSLLEFWVAQPKRQSPNN